MAMRPSPRERVREVIAARRACEDMMGAEWTALRCWGEHLVGANIEMRLRDYLVWPPPRS